MRVSFFLYSAEDDSPLTGASPELVQFKRLNATGGVIDLDAPEIEEHDGLYDFEIDDALFAPGSVISYVIDCTVASAARYLEDHISADSTTSQSVSVPTSPVDLTLKRGDLAPAFTATLYDETTGTPIDLTGDDVEVTFRLRGAGGGAVVVDGATATIVSAKKGRVKYEWQDGDTATVGEFDAEFTVTGTPRTLPQTRYYSITILPTLAD